MRQWLSERLELERRLEEAQRSVELVTQKALREKAQLLDSERMLKEQLKSMAVEKLSERPLQTTAVAPSNDLQALKAGFSFIKVRGLGGLGDADGGRAA